METEAGPEPKKRRVLVSEEIERSVSHAGGMDFVADHVPDGRKLARPAGTPR